MAAQKVVPTMSVDGWVVGVKQRVDRLFAYWLANQRSQSYLAYGSIISFQYDVQQYGSFPEELAAVSGRNLEGYLNQHFDAVAVVALVKYPNGESNGLYHIEFDVKVTHEGTGWDIGRTLIEITDGVFRKIIEGQ